MVEKKSLLALDYPSADQWRKLLEIFPSEAIAHKLLLSTIPFIFREEPLKFALFRRTIAEHFGVKPTDVFIVGSALAGRSLKGDSIDKEYRSESDIDTLIISEHLFATYIMQSFEWVKEATHPNKSGGLSADEMKQIGRLSMNACKGIWRPDSLPQGADAREAFFNKFSAASLNVLGLQLSDDTVARVNGRIARSFDDAIQDLASSLRHLKRDLEDDTPTDKSVVTPLKTKKYVS